jgi:hypothetical protein
MVNDIKIIIESIETEEELDLLGAELPLYIKDRKKDLVIERLTKRIAELEEKLEEVETSPVNPS